MSALLTGLQVRADRYASPELLLCWLLVYHSHEPYLAWLETWDNALSTVGMLMLKLLLCEASPQREITFGPPTSNSCGATSANVVVSQALCFSSSAWLQLAFWVLWNRHRSSGVC